MSALEDARHLQFRVETLVVNNGRELKKMRPDADGYFTKVPIAALGIATRNRTYYDIDSFHREITQPGTMFNQRLTGGQLYGELGHPDITDMQKPAAIARLMNIDERNWSHHFRAVEHGASLEGGGVLLVADIKPTGVGGETVQQNFENPYMNTAFSLRSITDARMEGGISRRRMKKLITFDFVGAGGYFEASKLFADQVGMESFDVDITPLGNAAFTECSMESFSDTELNDFFGTNNVGIVRQIVTLVRPREERFSQFQAPQLKSKFRDMFGEGLR